MPDIREVDGLALSSRNARLDPAARQIALALHQVSHDAARRLLAGESMAYTLNWARAAVVPRRPTSRAWGRKQP